MLRGYAMGWFGLILGLAGVILIIASFDNGFLFFALGIVLLVGGGYCRYVSAHTVRTTD
jgi:drug/metabolite transporter (DMT)-like permease